MMPLHIQRRYLRGGCVAFAIALKRELGLPIHVLVDRRHDGKDDWVHAFVADLERSLAVDVRGVMDLNAEAVASGAYILGIPEITSATAKEAFFRMDCFPTASEINEARKVVRTYIQPLVDQSRAAVEDAPGLQNRI